jgi:hypothetical protein
MERAALMLTEAHLKALVEAWATGVVRGRYADGSEFQYRSRADLEAQIARVADTLGVANPTRPTRRKSPVIYANYRRG